MLILLSYIDNISLLWQVAVCYSCSFLYSMNSKICIALQFLSHWYKKTDRTWQMEQIFPSNSLPQKIKKGRKKEWERERERERERTVGPTLSKHLKCYIFKEKNKNKAVPHLTPTQKNNLSRSNMNPYKNIQIFAIQTRSILLFITSLDNAHKVQSQGISVKEN